MAKNIGVEIVHASPTKAFFVSMLTRDIELNDAILDLLDNCVDGVLRLLDESGTQRREYNGYHAKISFDGKHFAIEDNCGGIPKGLARNYAFRMGRAGDRDSNIPTVGIYGIGMKRAIFKMGMAAHVKSQHKNDSFMINIPPEWISDDSKWELELHPIRKPFRQKGTRIEISQIYPNICSLFSDKSGNYERTLRQVIAEHYCYILQKGFKVYVNGVSVDGKPINLLMGSFVDAQQGKGLAPYIYKNVIGDVKVDLAVGFNFPMPSEEELETQQQTRRSKDLAGWTVICNDRVVAYCDKGIQTGWGEAGVPHYHSQFIAISGVVFFQSNKPWNLPMNTTKRGVDNNSELYLNVKNYMREGLKHFTNYTNKWKGDSTGEKAYSNLAKPVDALQIIKIKPNNMWTKVKHSKTEIKFVPALPAPKDRNPKRQVRFAKLELQIKRVSKLLFNNPDISPAEVGEKCFDIQLKEADRQ